MTVNYTMDLGIYIFGKRAYIHDFVTSEKVRQRGRLTLLINSERRNFISAGRKLPAG